MSLCRSEGLDQDTERVCVTQGNQERVTKEVLVGAGRGNITRPHVNALGRDDTGSLLAKQSARTR